MRDMVRKASAHAAKTAPKATSRKPRWAKEGARLDAILKERNIGSSEFAAHIGVKYYNIFRWRRGFEFTEANQALAARGLGLPEQAFVHRGTLRKRRAQADRTPPRPSTLETSIVLEEFRRERPELAATLTVEEWRVLRSVRFYDPTLRPSVAFFEAVAFGLRGAIPIDEIEAIARENAELDRTLAHKRPPKRR